MNSESEKLLQQFFDQPLCVDTSDINKEANQNLFYLSDPKVFAPGEINDIQNFFNRVIQIIKEKLLLNHDKHPMTFYSWFDEQASQLRFSLISTVHNELPFKCSVQKVDSLPIVINQFLENAHQGINMEELTDSEGAENELEDDYEINVWTKRIE